MSADRDHYRARLRAGMVAKGEKLSAAECRDLLQLLDHPEPRRRGNPHRDAAKRQELLAARLVALDLRGRVEVEKNVRTVAEQENVHRATVYAAKRRWFDILRPIFQRLPSEGWDAYIASLEADQ